MKRRSFCFLLVLTCLAGCGNKTNNLNQDEMIYTETSTVDSSDREFHKRTTGNALLDAQTELSDVRGDMGGEVTTGQSEIIRIKKADFKHVTESEFAEYVTAHNDTVHDWFAIVFEDETAIIFQNHLTRIVYGTWDEEKGIESSVAGWERSVNEEFPYKEWMEIINGYAPLPIPPYPLSTDTITEALQEYGLSHKLQEDEQVQEMRPEQSLISLLDSESGEFAAGISSGQKDGERILFISFPRFHSTNPILREECEDAVVFATRLFGGFESADQVYDSFVQDYDTVNTERVQYERTDSSTMPMREGESYWESSIGGTTCRITFEQPSLSEPEEYLSVILFTSDWDTFYPEEEEKRE